MIVCPFLGDKSMNASDAATFQNILCRYLQHFPEERELLGRLSSLLEGGADPFDRKNMEGHITASALVFDPDEARVLLVHHRGLNLWIQPGGHIEATDPDLMAAVRREVAEETGVTELQPHPWHADRPFPFHINSHRIPARPAKGEGAHWHHDALYLMRAPAGAEIRPQLEEVGAVRWVPPRVLQESTDPTLRGIYAKVSSALEAMHAL